MRRTAVATALAAVLALGTACSDGGSDPEANPSEGGTTTSAPASDDPTPTESASDDPTSDVEPASGFTLTLAHSTVKAPAGWKHAADIVRTMVGADDPESVTSMALGEVNAFGQTPDADQLGDIAIAAGEYPTEPKKLPNSELDGVEVYHIAGKVQPLNYLEEFGAVVGDRIVTLTFEFSPAYSPQERQELVDSVTATFAWR